MLWKVRTTLADRPGALAELARRCGEAGVNILGLQIFPGVGTVTDELLLRTPADWSLARVAELLEDAGGSRVSVVRCTESALVDQPTRYVEAARTVLDQPASFAEVVAALFDAEPDRADEDDPLARVQDVLDLTVRDVTVQVRRLAPFTATERARASSLADLVDDVLARNRRLTPAVGRRVDPSAVPSYDGYVDGVRAVVDGTVVGHATFADVPDEEGVAAIDLYVDPAWRRRGIGTRLLRDAAREAGVRRIRALVLTTRADNQAALAIVLASGLRGRIRMAGDTLTVRIPVVSPVSAPAQMMSLLSTGAGAGPEEAGR
jgi:ribosomal protein S18 acetylase RimI-like enzyme